MTANNKDTTFFRAREVMPSNGDPVAIIKASLEKIQGFKGKKLEAKDFQGVTSKEQLKKVIIDFLDTINSAIPLANPLSRENTTNAVSSLVDTIWDMYEAVKDTFGTFWDWIKNGGATLVDQIWGLFTSKIGSPRQLAMRSCIDRVYALGCRFSVSDSTGDFVILNQQGVVMTQLTEALKNINGQEAVTGTDVKDGRGATKQEKIDPLKEEFSSILTERSATAQGHDRFTKALVFSGINPHDSKQVEGLDRNTLCNVYLNWAQQEKKPNERILMDKITLEALDKMNMPIEQKDFIRLQLNPKAQALFQDNDLDFFKKAVEEHTKLTSFTATSLKDHAKDIGSKTLDKFSEFAKNPKDILKHANGLELAALLAFAVSALIFDVTGKRKQIWMGIGGLLVGNMLVKGISGDPEKDILHYLGLGAKKGRDAIRGKQMPYIEKVYSMLSLNEKSREVLETMALVPSEKIFNYEEGAENKNGLIIEETSEGKQRLKFANYEKLFTKEQRKDFDTQFGEGKAEEKILDMIDSVFKQIGKRQGMKDDQVNKKAILEYIQKTYAAGRGFVFGQVVNYELLVFPGLSETKIDAEGVLLGTTGGKMGGDRFAKQSQKVGKNSPEVAIPTDKLSELADKYKGTAKQGETVLTKEAFKRILTANNYTNASKIETLKKYTTNDKNDASVLEEAIKLLEGAKK